MTDTAAHEQQDQQENQKPPGSSGMGAIKGVPGKNITGVGSLDLRGVDPKDLAQIESITGVGVVLIDPDRGAALAGCEMTGVGAMLEVDEDYRVIVGPFVEFSRASVEAMSAGQKLAIIGITLVKPDVPAAMIAEKIERAIVVGVFLATAAVQGALMGKTEITGSSATLPDTAGPVVQNIGENKVSAGYLKYLEDGSIYINVGQTTVADDVDADLLARKFTGYVNVGSTVARQDLLDLLKARCSANLGSFQTPEEAAKEDQ